MPTIKEFGSALLKAVEGFLDAAIGIATDGFIVEIEEDEVKVPISGGIVKIPKIVFIIDFNRRKKIREDREILELL